ncbi:MAG TPA: trypsin-like serine protease, partial [Verrucomicrobiae bacterium]
MLLAQFKSPALAGIFSLLLFPVAVLGATIRDDTPDSDYVALGNDPAFDGVGTFVNSWGYTGCGILIAPDWVLTAAHLFTAATSGTFTLDGTAYSSTQLITDPNWNGSASNGSDFGLIHLSSPITSITPLPFYTSSTLLEQTATFVGYGLTGTGLT